MTVKKAGCQKAPSGGNADNTYFKLAKTFKRKVKECSRDSESGNADQVVFLWICVTSAGLKPGLHGNAGNEQPLSPEQWLNVVDEAASLGANWLVLSLTDPLSKCPHIWEICAWAQRAHDMMVGLHLKDAQLKRGDLTAAKKINPDKTRLLVRADDFDSVQWVEKEGIRIWTANPQANGERPHCQGPRRMIFVNASGVLYTCGLVEGNNAYRMGHVFDGALKRVISDPELPHHVHEDLHIVTPGCDGCPSLIANFFTENA